MMSSSHKAAFRLTVTKPVICWAGPPKTGKTFLSITTLELLGQSHNWLVIDSEPPMDLSIVLNDGQPPQRTLAQALDAIQTQWQPDWGLSQAEFLLANVMTAHPLPLSRYTTEESSPVQAKEDLTETILPPDTLDLLTLGDLQPVLNTLEHYKPLAYQWILDDLFGAALPRYINKVADAVLVNGQHPVLDALLFERPQSSADTQGGITLPERTYPNIHCIFVLSPQVLAEGWAPAGVDVLAHQWPVLLNLLSAEHPLPTLPAWAKPIGKLKTFASQDEQRSQLPQQLLNSFYHLNLPPFLLPRFGK